MTIVDPALEMKLCELVKSAGSKLMEYWPGTFRSRGREGLHVKAKPDGSFVTEADLVSNEILCEGIHRLCPGDGVLSEEGSPDPDLSSKEIIWIVDPLDGTQTFIDGNDDFAILMARCSKAKLDFGIMYLPAREQLAVASRGRGAKLDDVPMHVSSDSEIRPQGLYFRHIKHAGSALVFPRWLDSSMAFLRLCRGEFDGLAVRIVNHQEWDLATAAVLIEESGGMVTDHNGQKLVFGSGVISFPYFVASNGKVHSQILEMIAKSTA